MLLFANIIPYSKRLGSQYYNYETLPWSSWSNLGVSGMMMMMMIIDDE